LRTAAAKPRDAELMESIQEGDRAALAELYRRLAPRAYRTALSICHERECAQDAVQDGFVAIWSSRATYAPARGSVLTWATTIVRNRAIYLARRRSRASTSDRLPAQIAQQPASDDVAGEFAARNDAREIGALLASLPPAQREVIRLGFFDGLTHEQIACRLALPAGTVKGRMRLGLRKLRSGLES